MPDPNVRQLKFIEAVVSGMTHKAAAIAAGYSPNNVAETAPVLYRNFRTEIDARRMQALRPLQEVVDLSVHRTVVETWHHAHHDPRRVMSWGPGGVWVRPSEELTPEEARLIKSVSSTVTEHVDRVGRVTSRVARVKVELVDRQVALHRLAEYQGLTAGDPNLSLQVPGSVDGATRAAEDQQAASAKLAEEIREVSDDELMKRWAEHREREKAKE